MDQGATTLSGRADDRAAPPRRVWAFAGYVFDLDGCSLAREDGGAVALTRGELALLREFVQRPGRVLSREMLLDAIAGRHADPFDRSIDVQVGRLRRKIEPDPKQPSLILTVPGEGYKFVASLRAVPSPPDIAPAPTSPAVQPARVWSRRGALAMAGGGGMAALGAVAGWRLWPATAQPPANVPGVVVLPFENLSGDPTRQYMADEVTLDVRTMLSTFPGIRVLSAPAGWGKDVHTAQEAAQRVGARYAVAGGVLRIGDRLRIVAQMYGADDGAALWAERYEVASTNPFGPQEDVANRVYDSLASFYGGIRREEARVAWSKAAPELNEYDYFLRSHALHVNFTWDDVRRARAVCAEGLAKFPGSALLHIMMGFSYTWGVMNLFSDNPAADIDNIWRYANEARELSTGSPMATWKLHWLMAFADQWHGNDFAGSVREARAAIALVPYEPMSRNDLSWILANAGHFDEAIEWARFSIHHEPNGPPFYYANLVWAYYLTGRYEEALKVPLQPEFIPDYFAVLHVRLGRMAEARRMAALAVKVTPRDSVEVEARFPLIEPYHAAYVEDLRKAGMRERA